MASKQKLKDIQESAEREQELLDEIEELQGETARQATEIRAYKARDTERQRREHRAQQEKRQAAEQKERRDRINDLAAGKLSLKGATQWAIVHEEGAQPGIEVFVPLDDEEQTVVLGYLRRKDTTPGITLPGYITAALVDDDRLFADEREFCAAAGLRFINPFFSGTI